MRIIYVSFFFFIFISQSFSQWFCQNSHPYLKLINVEYDSSVIDIEIKNEDVWLGTALGADYSSNLGITWIHFDSTNGLGVGGACGLSISDNLSAIPTYSYQSDSSFSYPVGTGISFSTNNGMSWQHVPQPLDQTGDSIIQYGINDSLWIRPISSPMQNLAYDICQQNNIIWIASFAGGLRKIPDLGQHWERVLLPLDSMNSINPTDTLWTIDPITLQKKYARFDVINDLNLRVFSAAIENENTIWCGTAGGINKSTDLGVSWIKFNHKNQVESISGNFVVALHYNKMNNVIWAATWRAEGFDEFNGVSFSTNGGQTWSVTLPEVQLHNFFSNDDTIIVAADDGLYRSVNGFSWQYFQPVPDSNIYDVAKDMLGRLWIASSIGIRIIYDEPSLWLPLSVSYESYPMKFLLSQNYPNPFNPSTRINYQLPIGRFVTLKVYDILGRVVATLVDEYKPSGSHKVEFNGSKLSSGIYFYKMQAGDFRDTKKLILIK